MTMVAVIGAAGSSAARCWPRRSGDPIPGLYAAGEVTGGFYGALYLSGSALARAAIAGRRAGSRVAALKRAPEVTTT